MNEIHTSIGHEFIDELFFLSTFIFDRTLPPAFSRIYAIPWFKSTIDITSCFNFLLVGCRATPKSKQLHIQIHEWKAKKKLVLISKLFDCVTTNSLQWKSNSRSHCSVSVNGRAKEISRKSIRSKYILHANVMKLVCADYKFCMRIFAHSTNIYFDSMDFNQISMHNSTVTEFFICSSSSLWLLMKKNIGKKNIESL